jgi:hypothetical protein
MLTFKTFYKDPRGWIAELSVDAPDAGGLFSLVDDALHVLLQRGCIPLDPYAAPVAARVAANLAGARSPHFEPAKRTPEPDELPLFPDEEAPVVCPIHKVEMGRREDKAGRVWWSHRYDETWCNGKVNHA